MEKNKQVQNLIIDTIIMALIEHLLESGLLKKKKGSSKDGFEVFGDSIVNFYKKTKNKLLGNKSKSKQKRRITVKKKQQSNEIENIIMMINYNREEND